jgi:hypothetical protein
MDMTDATPEQADSPALRAAARLPRVADAGDSTNRSDLSPREFVAFLICMDVFFAGFVAFMGVKIGTEVSFGWVYLLAGLPAWLLVRVLFFSMRGSEFGLVTVDRAGIVRVVTGKRSVRRLAKMYEHGAASWMRGGILRGLAFFLVGMGGLLAVTLLLDSPEPILVFLTGSLWTMLDLVRFSYVLLVKARRHGQQTLDGVDLLPMLAAYGRRHGWREAVSGVPADRLLDVLAEHPDDARQLKEYAVAHRALSGLATPVARLGSSVGPF